MKKLLLTILLASGIAGAQEPTLRWAEFHPPEYPPIARIAHISGIVNVKFILKSGGAIRNLDVQGHPLLLKTSIESLRKSKLQCDGCSKNGTEFIVSFNYAIAGDYECTQQPAVVKLQNANQITMTANPVANCYSTATRTVTRVKVRSMRCLYMWKCAHKTVEDTISTTSSFQQD